MKAYSEVEFRATLSEWRAIRKALLGEIDREDSKILAEFVRLLSMLGNDES